MKSLKDHLGAAKLRHAIIFGTGLSEAIPQQAGDRSLAYGDIAGFPPTHVSGHEGRLILRQRGADYDAFLLGRAHYYEHGDPAAMKHVIRSLADCGAESLILTCAAGSTRAELGPGAIVLIEDHINLSGTNPLFGETGDARFVSMINAYDPALRQRLDAAAQSAGLVLARGIYMWFSGPSFETPAEIRMARQLGADVVGMSTVPEVILARACGLPVAALAIVTNHAAGLAGGAPTHADTKRVAAQAAQHIAQIIAPFLAQEF
jgi:purine-nucleoside phosphorylase